MAYGLTKVIYVALILNVVGTCLFGKYTLRKKLLNLFGCCKYLRCEALYQLTALSIACWFKSNPNIEDFLEPKHNNNPNLFKILHEKFPYIVDDTVKKNFEL